MKKEPSDKEKFLSSFIDMIEWIADLSYQERIWVREEGPQIGYFFDHMLDFLEHCELILQSPKERGLSSSESDSLKALFEKVDEYYCSPSGKQPDSEIIKDPKWLRICKFAKKVLNKFEHYRIPDESL